MTNCPFCGKLTDPKLAACPHCGGPLRSKSSRLGGASGRSAPAHQCPNCKSPVQEGDIICVRCGTNLLTGQKVAEEQRQDMPRESRRWL
ncbi:MAG TPA: zinc ribbon domain-containing protein, partial [Candidatus Hydrogenedentes bacterium]|nr:zinc ribbon domain-containing protein [Candidatus Hydrogenedentota bacterium]